MYSIIHAIDLICVLVSSYKLIKIIKNKRNETYEEHKLSIIFFSSLICCIIIVRISFIQDLNNNGWFAILRYSIVELIILLIFSIFKKDEDCFACFNRSN